MTKGLEGDGLGGREEDAQGRASLYKPISWGSPSLCSSGGQVLMGPVFRYVGAPGGFQVRSFLELRSDDILEVALDRGFVGASATWARILGWER